MVETERQHDYLRSTYVGYLFVFSSVRHVVCSSLQCLTFLYLCWPSFSYVCTSLFSITSDELTQDPKLCTWEHVLDHDKAALMWDTWKFSPEKCPYSNTVTNGIFYVRVPTAITVNYESAITRENSVEALLHKTETNRHRNRAYG